nr:uncharacterized protein LOC123767378 isoform X1 [Procambarus clarkii]
MDKMAVMCSQDMERPLTHKEILPVQDADLSKLHTLEKQWLYNSRTQNVKRPISQIQDNELEKLLLNQEVNHGMPNVMDIEQKNDLQNLDLKAEIMASPKKNKLLTNCEIHFNKGILWRCSEKSTSLPLALLNHNWLRGIPENIRKQVSAMRFVDYVLLVKIEVRVASIFERNKEEADTGFTIEYIYSELIKNGSVDISHLPFVLSQSNLFIYDSTTELWKKKYTYHESDKVSQEIKWRGILAMRKAWTNPGTCEPSCVGKVACLEVIIGKSFMTENQILQEVCYTLSIPRCQEIMDSIQRVLASSSSFSIFQPKKDENQSSVMLTATNTTQSSSSAESTMAKQLSPKNNKEEEDGPIEHMTPRTITITDSQNLQSPMCSEGDCKINVSPDFTLQPNFALECPSEPVKEVKESCKNSDAPNDRKQKEVQKPGHRSSDRNASKEQYLVPLRQPRRRSCQNVSKEQYFVPLQQGWVREIVFRAVSESANRDVYYHTPTGRKLRSRVDIAKYLKNENVENLTVENFTFNKFLFEFGEPYEVIRNAKFRKRKIQLNEEDAIEGILKKRLNSTTTAKAKTPGKKKSVYSTSAAKPTASDAKLTASAAKLTASDAKPTASDAKPTASAAKPTAPAAKPTAPAAKPTAPAAKLTAPAAKPTAPAAKPTAPAAKPTAPAAKPTAPAAKPTAPAAKPTAPAAKPTAPAAKPTAPAAKPTAPAAKPTTPAAKPTAPAAKPTAPAAKPTAPAAKPTAPPAKPTAPPAKPTAPAAKPTAPAAKPTAPPAKPTASPAKPTAPPAKPTAPAAKPTTPAAKPSLGSEDCWGILHEKHTLKENDGFEVTNEIGETTGYEDWIPFTSSKPNVAKQGNNSEHSLKPTHEYQNQDLLKQRDYTMRRDTLLENRNSQVNNEIQNEILEIFKELKTDEDYITDLADIPGPNKNNISIDNKLANRDLKCEIQKAKHKVNSVSYDSCFKSNNNGKIYLSKENGKIIISSQNGKMLGKTSNSIQAQVCNSDRRLSNKCDMEFHESLVMSEENLKKIDIKKEIEIDPETPDGESVYEKEMSESLDIKFEPISDIPFESNDPGVPGLLSNEKEYCSDLMSEYTDNCVKSEINCLDSDPLGDDFEASNGSLPVISEIQSGEEVEKLFSFTEHPLRLWHPVPTENTKTCINTRNVNSLTNLQTSENMYRRDLPLTHEASVQQPVSLQSSNTSTSATPPQCVITSRAQESPVSKEAGQRKLPEMQCLPLDNKAKMTDKYCKSTATRQNILPYCQYKKASKKIIGIIKNNVAVFQESTANDESLRTFRKLTMNTPSEKNTFSRQIHNIPKEQKITLNEKDTNLSKDLHGVVGQPNISQRLNNPESTFTSQINNSSMEQEKIQQYKNVFLSSGHNSLRTFRKLKTIVTAPLNSKANNIPLYENNVPKPSTSNEEISISLRKFRNQTRNSALEASTRGTLKEGNIKIQKPVLCSQLNESPSQQTNLPTQPSSGQATNLISQQTNLLPRPSSGQATNLISQQTNLPTQPSSGQVTNLISQQKHLPTQPSNGQVTNLISQPKMATFLISQQQIATNLISQQKELPTQSSSGQVTNLISQQKHLPTQPSSGQVTNLISQQKNLPTRPSIGQVSNLISQQKNLPTQSSSGQVTNLISQQKIATFLISQQQIATNLISQQKNLPTQSSSGQVTNLISEQKIANFLISQQQIATNLISQQKNLQTQSSSGQVTNLISQPKMATFLTSQQQTVTNLISQQTHLPTQPSSGQVTNLISQQTNLLTQPSSGQVTNLISQQTNLLTQPSSGQVTNLISQQKHLPTQPSSGQVTNLISQQTNLPTRPSSGQATNLISQQTNLPTQPSSGQVTNLISQQTNLPTQPSSGQVSKLTLQLENVKMPPFTIKEERLPLPQKSIILTQPLLKRERFSASPENCDNASIIKWES